MPLPEGDGHFLNELQLLLRRRRRDHGRRRWRLTLVVVAELADQHIADRLQARVRRRNVVADFQAQPGADQLVQLATGHFLGDHGIQFRLGQPIRQQRRVVASVRVNHLEQRFLPALILGQQTQHVGIVQRVPSQPLVDLAVAVLVPQHVPRQTFQLWLVGLARFLQFRQRRLRRLRPCGRHVHQQRSRASVATAGSTANRTSKNEPWKTHTWPRSSPKSTSCRRHWSGGVPHSSAIHCRNSARGSYHTTIAPLLQLVGHLVQEVLVEGVHGGRWSVVSGQWAATRGVGCCRRRRRCRRSTRESVRSLIVRRAVPSRHVLLKVRERGHRSLRP